MNAFQQFIKYCFTLWVYNVAKNKRWAKNYGQKTKDDNFSTEKTEEKQNSVTIMISGDGKETFFQ